MNVLNLCPKKEVIVQYRNGTQTNKDIVEYQAEYRKKKRVKKKEYVFKIEHTNK